MKKVPEIPIVLSSMWVYNMKIDVHKTGSKSLPNTELDSISILAFSTSRTVRKKSLLFIVHPIYGIFLKHPDRQRHVLTITEVHTYKKVEFIVHCISINMTIHISNSNVNIKCLGINLANHMQELNTKYGIILQSKENVKIENYTMSVGWKTIFLRY